MTERQWEELIHAMLQAGLEDGFEVTVRMLDSNGLVSLKAQGRETAWRLTA